MAAFDSYPPNGLDRATGLGGLPGTPTPDSAIVVVPGPYYFEELPESPQIERAEQATIVHRFRCDQATGQNLIVGLSRGFIQTDSGGNQTRILSARYDQERADKCVITTTAEGLNFDVPPDEYGIEVVEFNPDLSRHPKFLPVTQYNSTDQNNAPVFGPQIISQIKTAASQLQLSVQQDGASQLNDFYITDPTVLELAQLLLQKYLQGEETFYLPGLKVTYSSYYWQPPLLSMGGYLEDPVYSGILPAYFWSYDQTPTGINTLLYLAQLVAPVYYGNGFSSLRLADSVTYQRTWFKLTSQWIMGPYGHWDTDIYDGQPA